MYLQQRHVTVTSLLAAVLVFVAKDWNEWILIPVNTIAAFAIFFSNFECRWAAT